MIRLRGHHLICLHFFQGEGYNPGFVYNLKEVLHKAGSGTQITITKDADDVCVACPHILNGKCAHKPDSEETIRFLDDMALKLLGVTHHEIVTWEHMRDLTMAIPDYKLTQFCTGCDWEDLCNKVKRTKED